MIEWPMKRTVKYSYSHLMQRTVIALLLAIVIYSSFSRRIVIKSFQNLVKIAFESKLLCYVHTTLLYSLKLLSCLYYLMHARGCVVNFHFVYS